MLLDCGGLADGILEIQDHLLGGLLFFNGLTNDFLEIVLGGLMSLLFSERDDLGKISESGKRDRKVSGLRFRKKKIRKKRRDNIRSVDLKSRFTVK